MNNPNLVRDEQTFYSVRTYKMLSIIIDFCASSPSVLACSVRCTHCKLVVKVLKEYPSYVQNLGVVSELCILCLKVMLVFFCGATLHYCQGGGKAPFTVYACARAIIIINKLWNN